ncbi:hypothetical protein AVI51_06795 [Piscirickettsia salmonis]|uniref:Uncharacterized protein n=1 Tax=Piscirickettsia salmonis TaxID=1238 RepID=A0A9Q5V8W7_PISSA|nr:hypothetical protein [Piscirickettsia salmonis]ALA25784.1 heme ABC transporter ATP-binding protein [Piscirickettsia salmonis]APS43267.1 hypothetical protein AVI48_01990 [Piscirickettsia salmonis]APS46616.1 hypothetical protein AVI49_02595 [Piscirickettsia salmonis]APS50593.1 hypothetical protein AVI50_06870 [Piscirickettsia salmonis]APS53796.1 hypothetical protein AVI51_06795 [Piscirickettsia salmonis]
MKVFYFKLDPDSSSDGRRITVFNKYPMYESTGTSDNVGKYPNTWFPFKIINPTTRRVSGGQIICGQLVKAHFTAGESLDLLKYFPKGVIAAFGNDADFLRRAGNLEALCLSASLGGGQWELERRKSGLAYLKTHYQHLLVDDAQLDQKVIWVCGAEEMNRCLVTEGSQFTLVEGPRAFEMNVFPENTYTQCQNAVAPSSPQPLFQQEQSQQRNSDDRSEEQANCLVM